MNSSPEGGPGIGKKNDTNHNFFETGVGYLLIFAEFLVGDENYSLGIDGLWGISNS